MFRKNSFNYNINLFLSIIYLLNDLAYRTKWIIIILILWILSTTRLPEMFAQELTEQVNIVSEKIKTQRIINLEESTPIEPVSTQLTPTELYSWEWSCIWNMSTMQWTWLQIYNNIDFLWIGNWSWFDSQQMLLWYATGVLMHEDLINTSDYLLYENCKWSSGIIIYPGESEYLSWLLSLSGWLQELPPLFTGVRFMSSWTIISLSTIVFDNDQNISDNMSVLSEKQDRHVVYSRSDFLSKIKDGTIVSKKQHYKHSRDGDKSNMLEINEDISYQVPKLQAYIESGTDIFTAQWQELQINNFALHVVDQPIVDDTKWSTIEPDRWQETIEFGTPWDHLIFTKPVMITYQSDLSDGTIIDLSVKHADDVARSTQWLSIDSDANCDLEGNTDKPGSQTIVQSGQISFYTCGASLFTMNSVWGWVWSNDLRILIGDYGQMQVYYDGAAQIVGGNPPANGAGGPSVLPILRVGGTNVGNGAAAWNTASTTWSWFDNTYNAITTLSYITWGLTYGVKINWNYIAPSKVFTQSYTWTIPAGNTQNVKRYYGVDANVAGTKPNDVWYYSGGANPTVGIYDSVANIFLAQKYISGMMWSWYISATYTIINTLTVWWGNYPNTTDSIAWNLWFWTNWDFGTTPGIYTSVIEWPVKPYVSSGVVDIIPWVWQPQGKLVVWLVSQMPITVDNVGLIASTGLHQIRLTVPTNLSWSSTGFMSNWWSCGAQSGTTVTCTKVTSISPTTWDSLNIPVTPTLAANGTTPTFTVVFSGGSDSNLTNNTGTVLTAIPVGLNTLLTNASIWLKANVGTNCIVDGCAISKWNDVWGSNNHAIQNTRAAQPLYKVNALNWNPVINFDTTAKYLVSTTWWTYRTIFAVRNLEWTGYQYLFSAPALSDFSVRSNVWFNGTNNLTYTDWPNWNDWSSGGSLAVNGKTTNIGKVNYHLVRAVSQTGIANKGYSISNSFTSRWMYGNDSVAEMLVYNTGVSLVNTQIIQSYLSTKYGITLDQSVTGWQNYVLSNSAISWSTWSAGVYNSDIAGVARDDDLWLSQMKSQSINNASDIIVEKASTFANFKNLMWGNNAAAVGSRTATELWTWLISKSRIAREWKIQEKNGDLGMVTVTYPVTTGSVPAGTMYLLVDTDGDFSNGGTTEYTGSIVSWYWSFNLSISDADVITFGIKTSGVSNGTLCITWPDTFILGSVTVLSNSQIIELQSNFFSVNDQKGVDNWYYTTLTVTWLVGARGWAIDLSNIQIKADPISILSWSSNSWVIISSLLSWYSVITGSPISFIRRNMGSNAWVLGEYGSKLRFKITIPSYQSVDIYTWSITYTLYEN